MYSKKLAVSNIIYAITSSTEMHFQEKMFELIDTICKYKGVEFERVQPANGDAKNDGWIPAKNIYFAMYSPSDKNLSQIAQINNKLSSDLDGLCDHVYNKEHWGGCINEFYLIVNTHDKEMPADPDRLNDKTIAEIKSKYNKDFVVKVMAAKSISSYLIDCDENLLEKLKVALDVYTVEHAISIPEIHDFIDEYVSYLAIQNLESNGTDFNRIQIDKKIDLNNLQNLKENIINKMDAAERVEKYLNTMNSEGWNDNSWLETKNYVISKYNELSKSYSGEDLYNKLLDELLCNEKLIGYKSVILEAIVIDIFIKCDIFAKE